MPLRPYQVKAITKINEALSAGISRQLLVMPTGSGKTEVFSHLPEILKHRLPGQMMVLLHRDELAQQAINKLRKRNPHLNVQQEAGTEHCDPTSADAIVASVQTLGRKGTTRLDKFNKHTLDKFVVDEAHRSIADSYYNVYKHFDICKMLTTVYY
jgi:ATP-dependent helicase IRC3